MNLIGNAIDALEEVQTEKGFRANFLPIIRIRTEVLCPNQVTVSITDNGSGITEEAKGQLFDPFFTTKPMGKGTGLGLSISYQIVVEKHKGSLRCESRPGEGTEFLIEIPLQHSNEHSAHASASVAVTS
jgi:signal transduction histidine kinase